MVQTEPWLYAVVPDNCGRLIGKRLAKSRYDEAAGAGMPMPAMHLATGRANVPREGIAAFGAHTGFGNGLLRIDPETEFRSPGTPNAQWYLSDALDAAGDPVVESSRNILRHQLNRLKEHGLSALMSSELEFYLFDQTYAELAEQGYRNLKPFFWRHGDNDPLVALVEREFMDLLEQDMAQAGIVVDQIQPEGGVGQMEINVAPATPMRSADQHVIFKHVVKSRCLLADKAATFLAKPFADQAGSSGHIHLCLMNLEGVNLLKDVTQPQGPAASFIAGILKYCRDFMILFAPYHNSYRRIRPGAFAPINADWGWHDRNRMLRLTGSGKSARLEFRLPGADICPHLAYAGLIAAGLAGIAGALNLPIEGDQQNDQLPQNLPDAARSFATSDSAKAAFGAQVHAHLLSHVKAEMREELALVPDIDLIGGFESS